MIAVLADRIVLWSVLPTVALLIAALAWGESSLVFAALVALPTVVVASIATAMTWKTSMKSAVGGAVLAIIIRLVGLLFAALLVASADIAERAAAFACVACCFIAALMVDAILRSRLSCHEDPVRG